MAESASLPPEKRTAKKSGSGPKRPVNITTGPSTSSRPYIDDDSDTQEELGNDDDMPWQMFEPHSDYHDTARLSRRVRLDGPRFSELNGDDPTEVGTIIGIDGTDVAADEVMVKLEDMSDTDDRVRPRRSKRPRGRPMKWKNKKKLLAASRQKKVQELEQDSDATDIEESPLREKPERPATKTPRATTEGGPAPRPRGRPRKGIGKRKGPSLTGRVEEERQKMYRKRYQERVKLLRKEKKWSEVNKKCKPASDFNGWRPNTWFPHKSGHRSETTTQRKSNFVVTGTYKLWSKMNVKERQELLQLYIVEMFEGEGTSNGNSSNGCINDGVPKSVKVMPFEETCDLCSEPFRDPALYVIHENCYTMKRKMREFMIKRPQLEFDCEICGQEYENKCDLDKHVLYHFDPLYVCKVQIVVPDQNPPTEKSGELILGDCNHESYTISEATDHAKTHKELVYFKCIFPDCNRTIKDRRSAEDHVERAHFSDKQKIRAILDDQAIRLAERVARKADALKDRLEAGMNEDEVPKGHPYHIREYIDFNPDEELFKNLYQKSANFDTHCDLCDQSFKTIGIRIVHKPCYETRRLERLKRRLAKEREINGGKLACEIEWTGDMKLPGLSERDNDGTGSGGNYFGSGYRMFDCENCSLSFDQFTELIVHCEKHTIGEYKCNQCQITTPSEHKMILHLQYHTGVRLFKCTYPGCTDVNGFTKDVLVRGHIRNVHLAADEKACRLLTCPFRFDSIEDRLKHEKFYHPTFVDKVESGDLRRSSANQTGWTMVDANGGINRWEGPRNTGRTPAGLRTKSNGQVRELSGIGFKRPIELSEQARSVFVPEFDGSDKEKCREIMDWLKQFVKYNQPFNDTCKLCNQDFNSHASLFVHKPCYYVKRSRQLMEQGMQEGARYACDIDLCALTFESLEDLRSHTALHFNEEDNTCAQSVDGDAQGKNYLCIFDTVMCTRSFIQEKRAREHIMRDHLGIKPFKCEQCPRAYVSQKELDRHDMLQHRDSYRCPVIVAPYKNNKAHGRKKPNDQGVKCKLIFLEQSRVLEHIRKRHPEYDINIYIDQCNRERQQSTIDTNVDIINQL